MNLAIDFLGMHMKNPIIAASGTFGFGLEYSRYLDLNRDVGAISLKGLACEPWEGNAGVRVAETPAGMLNCIGLENPGAERFVKYILPQLRQYDVPLIANIVGHAEEEYAKVAEMISVPGISAIEMNISCPNVKNGSMAFGTDPETAARVTALVKANTDLPVMVKLSPNVTDIVLIAKAVEEAGADAISLINTLMGIAIDLRTRKPVLGNITGGLSGPAVKPVALRMVWQVAKAVKIPVCGLGGIMTGRDAAEFMVAGASAVQVGTATLASPDAIPRIAGELAAWGTACGVENVSDLTGTLVTE